MSSQVGVRELRQNLSVYLRRVEAGETLEVTDRRRPVALLTPLPPREESVHERLVREGRVRPATTRLEDLGPPLPATPGERPLSEILQEMRDGEYR